MTELAVFENPEVPALPARVGVPGTQDFDSWTQVAARVIRLAEVICDTPFVPDGMRGSAPAVAAAMLAGREMGLGPMTSLANLDVIKGKPSMKPVLMRALVQSQGHKWVDVEVTDVRVIIKGCRKGEAEWTEVTFTQAHAKLAGINLGGYPADKLYARASSRLARRKFADVIMGMPYSEDEIEDGVTQDGEAIGAPAPAAIEPPKPRTAQRRTRQAEKDDGKPVSASDPVAKQEAPPADRGLPPLPGEDEKPTQPPGDGGKHQKLVGVVQQHFSRLGVGDRNERLLACERIAMSGPLESSNDLSDQELSVVADTLSRCRDRKAMNLLLSAGEVGNGAEAGGDRPGSGADHADG